MGQAFPHWFQPAGKIRNDKKTAFNNAANFYMNNLKIPKNSAKLHAFYVKGKADQF